MKFVMYGAGSIGRGFIGPMFARAGYEVVFIDIDRNVIDALNRDKGYSFTVAADPPYDVAVGRRSGGGAENEANRGVDCFAAKGAARNDGVAGGGVDCFAVKGAARNDGEVRGVLGTDARAVAEEIAGCDVMATALGASVLQRIAPVIADGFSMRMKAGGKQLDIIICENLKDSARLLREWITSALSEDEKQVFNKRCGLVEAAVGRMIPPAARREVDPLHLTVEEYGFLPVDKDAFASEPPDVPGLIAYSPFAFYEERKLYLHNMSHALCAYFGLRQGHATIAEAAADPFVRLAVQGAMIESSEMLSNKYGVPFASVFDHAEDLLYRYGNVTLGDTCERVGRDPMRKLAAGDRLAGALRQCGEYGVHPVYISLGYAAALRNVTDAAAKTGNIADVSAESGNVTSAAEPSNLTIATAKAERDVYEQARSIAHEHGLLNADEIALVMRLFDAYELPAVELLRTVEIMKKELRGNTV